MNMSEKVNFEIPVLWLLEIATKKEVKFSELLKMQVRRCLDKNGYSKELNMATVEHISSIRRRKK